MELTRRVRRMEDRHARWFAKQVKDDPRWADPHFRQRIREMQLGLRAEERRHAQLREATRATAALIWETAGQPERAARVRRGEGHLPGEFEAALGALDDDGRRQLRAAAEAALQRLRAGLPCSPTTASLLTRTRTARSQSPGDQSPQGVAGPSWLDVGGLPR